MYFNLSKYLTKIHYTFFIIVIITIILVIIIIILVIIIIIVILIFFIKSNRLNYIKIIIHNLLNILDNSISSLCFLNI